MHLTVQSIRVEKQFEGPDAIKFRVEAPSGAVIDFVEEVPNGSGEALVKTLGPCSYEYFEARLEAVEGQKRKKLVIVEEIRTVEG